MLRKVEGLDDEGARWTPEGRLIPLVGIVNHLTRVEWRWNDGAMLGQDVDRTEEEVRPGSELTVADAVRAYRERAVATDEAARWTPEGRLIPLVGIVNHLTRVEWRWIDGTMLGQQVERGEEEFRPGPSLTLEAAVRAYRERALATDEAVRRIGDLRTPSSEGSADNPLDLRWVLLHLINETARHAGHADATRELLDGTTGE